MTDASGTVVWAADYKPFGEATITVSTITNNLRYPGMYFDAESGLHYNYRRDYNPSIGGYVEADRIGLRGGINLYRYVRNNPIRFIDPRGLKTTVIITYDFGLGTHAALHIDSGFLYDPGGDYKPGGQPLGSGGFATGADANLQNYIDYQKNTGSTVKLYELPTTPEQEQDIMDKAIGQGDEGPGYCAMDVSSALGGCGVKPTWFPGNLADQLKKKEKCP